jgi:hypothetical protein
MHQRSRALAGALAAFLGLSTAGAVAFAKPDKKELEQLIADTDAIAAKVSTIRGLPVKKTITRGIMSREQIEARVIQRMGEDQSDADLAGEERAAKRFGFLPADLDYKKTILGLLTEQIAGFYDPAVRELYLADWIDVATQKIVMAHEICHALQDQSFDLDKFTKAAKDDGDMSLARQALVEGDGVALMIEFMFQEMGVKVDPWVDDTITNSMAKQVTGIQPGMEAFAKAPLFLRESLMFPYLNGLKLIAFTRRHHPWSRVDDMFKTPPASTEQVMHPEKYFAGEKPVKVKSPALPSLKKWKTVEQNTLGEAAFGWLWRQHGVRDERANDAAAGWGGDHYAVFAPPDDDGKAIDKLVLVEYSVWDTETDATEAFDVAVEALPTWLGLAGTPAAPAAPAEKGPTFVRFETPDGAQSYVERKGSKLVLVVGQPAAAKKLRQEIWAKWK